ncbi:MAG: hypothetical protein HUJ73_00275, partial [Eubacterium sp.]|nr:hypothetical protein [Eubacterium sp.]
MLVLRAAIWLLLFGVLIPFMIGRPFSSVPENGKRPCAKTLLSGHILLLALFECIAVPVIFCNGSLKLLLILYLIGTAVLILFCIWKTKTDPKSSKTDVRKSAERSETDEMTKTPEVSETYSSEAAEMPQKTAVSDSAAAAKKAAGADKVLLIILAAEISVLVLWYIFMPVDSTDDTVYLAKAVSAYETGSLLRFDPLAGAAAGLSRRAAFSPLVIWEAMHSMLSGIHPAAFCRTILPVLLLPLSAASWLLLGNTVFSEEKFLHLKNDKKMTYGTTEPVSKKTFGLLFVILFFAALLAIRLLVGKSSLLPHIWQGEPVLVLVILPFFLTGVLRRWKPLLLVLTILAGLLCSLNALFLLPVVWLIAGLAGSKKNRAQCKEEITEEIQKVTAEKPVSEVTEETRKWLRKNPKRDAEVITEEAEEELQKQVLEDTEE